MKIGITPDRTINPSQVAQLLETGEVDYIFVRFPSFSQSQYKSFLDKIPPTLHSRLLLSDFHELVAKYKVGGIVLNSRNPYAGDNYEGIKCRSCHSIEEIARVKDAQWATLSPIFNSISKPGYNSHFNMEELKALDKIKHIKIIALGGLTPSNFERLKGLNFSGYAMMGNIKWD